MENILNYDVQFEHFNAKMFHPICVRGVGATSGVYECGFIAERTYERHNEKKYAVVDISFFDGDTTTHISVLGTTLEPMLIADKDSNNNDIFVGDVLAAMINYKDEKAGLVKAKSSLFEIVKQEGNGFKEMYYAKDLSTGKNWALHWVKEKAAGNLVRIVGNMRFHSEKFNNWVALNI